MSQSLGYKCPGVECENCHEPFRCFLRRCRTSKPSGRFPIPFGQSALIATMRPLTQNLPSIPWWWWLTDNRIRARRRLS
jgi:hypothetical protein